MNISGMVLGLIGGLGLFLYGMTLMSDSLEMCIRDRGSSTGFDDIAFVKFEFNFTCHIFLSGFNKCLNCFT